MGWKHWKRVPMKTAQSILSEKLYLEPKMQFKFLNSYIVLCGVKEYD